jgi:hypothetical protein
MVSSTPEPEGARKGAFFVAWRKSAKFVKPRGTNCMMVFERATLLVKEAEHLMMEKTATTGWKPLQLVLDFLVNVPMFSISGLGLLFRPIGVSFVLTPCWYALFWVIGKFNAPMPGTQLLLLAWLMAIASVTFSLPSSASVFGIKLGSVSSLAKFIRKIAPDAKTQRLVRAAVDGLSARCTAKILTVRWSLGIAWAGLVWLTSNWVLAAGLTTSFRNENATRAFVVLSLVVFFGLGAASYAAASRVLYQTIDLAFLEVDSDDGNANEDGFEIT